MVDSVQRGWWGQEEEREEEEADLFGAWTSDS